MLFTWPLQTTDLQTYDFSLKRPRADRRSFAIVKKLRHNPGRVPSSTIEDKRLAVLNRLYKQHTITFEEAEAGANAIIRDRYGAQRKRVPCSATNTQLLKDYWATRYNRRRLKDPRASYNGLRRAVDALGTVSLLTGTERALQKALDARYPDNRHIAMVGRLKEMLTHYGRTDIHLQPRRRDLKETTHLTLEEWGTVSARLPEGSFKAACWLAFTTGMRLGEVWAIRAEDVVAVDNTCYLRVRWQLDKRMNRVELKNRKPHNTFLLPEGWQWLDTWLQVSMEERKQLRNIRHADLLREACVEAGMPEEKQIVFHALRHSYAIHLAKAGVSMEVLGKLLGDSVATVECYYAHYLARDETMKLVAGVLHPQSPF